MAAGFAIVKIKFAHFPKLTGIVEGGYIDRVVKLAVKRAGCNNIGLFANLVAIAVCQGDIVGLWTRGKRELRRQCALAAALRRTFPAWHLAEDGGGEAGGNQQKRGELVLHFGR